MFKDMSIFFVIIVIELVAFACVGILSFGNLEQYNTLSGTLVMFFESALGTWDMTIYDKAGSDNKKWFGILFHVAVLIINMVLMLNLVIAILSDTYSAFSN